MPLKLMAIRHCAAPVFAFRGGQCPKRNGHRYMTYGAKRIRTADPLHAMQVLYQLSYSPEGFI